MQKYFDLKHILVIFGCMFFFIFFAMLFARKSKKVQRVMLVLNTIFLTLLEAGRIVWRYFYLKDTAQPLTFWNIINFDLYTVTLWISIIILYCCVFRDPTKKACQLGYSFIFSVASIPAMFGLLYPEGMYSMFPLYHFSNLQFLIAHSILLLIALLLAITDWLQNEKFEDIWYALFSLIIVGVVGVAIYFASRETLNIMYMQYCPLFEDLGLSVPWPWHIFIMGMFYFVAQLLLYVPFEIHRKIKNRRRK